MSVSVVYWSGTGNTQAMAEAVAEGIRDGGADAVLMEVGNADAAALAEEKAFALGCPSMGAEQLEESEMEPFVEALEPLVSGKTILLFGSYGWGDGEWMRDWADRMKNAGAVLIREEGIITNEAPDDEALEECRAAGKELPGSRQKLPLLHIIIISRKNSQSERAFWITERFCYEGVRGKMYESECTAWNFNTICRNRTGLGNGIFYEKGDE